MYALKKWLRTTWPPHAITFEEIRRQANPARKATPSRNEALTCLAMLASGARFVSAPPLPRRNEAAKRPIVGSEQR